MSWYGWIPILTSSLYTRKYFKDLQDRSELADNANFIITSQYRFLEFEKQIHKIRSDLALESGEPAFYYFCCTDYTNPPKYFLNVILFKDGLIKKIILLDDNYIPVGKSSISQINNGGLTQFELDFDSNKIAEDDLATIIFCTIRDMYHVHIFAKQADMALLPVKASSQDEAINKIIDQYQHKIINYHQQISLQIDRLERTRTSAATLRHLKSIMTRIEQAKGEMSYAFNFLNLFDKDIKKNVSSIKSAMESLNTIQSRIEYLMDIEAATSGLTITFLTMFIVFLTTFSTTKDHMTIKNGLMVSLASSIIVILLILIVRWYTLKPKKG